MPPDSTTRYIPLAALYDGEQYLIERFTVTTITAASETDTQEKVPQPTSRDPILLAMGASDFKGFAPLLNVPEELNIIAKTSDPKDTQGVYPGSEFLNTAFNFEALKQHLSSHKILPFSHPLVNSSLVNPKTPILFRGQGIISQPLESINWETMV